MQVMQRRSGIADGHAAQVLRTCVWHRGPGLTVPTRALAIALRSNVTDAPLHK
jgi:hypothetical protein